ncbi:hypothetical protein KBW81_18385 (plasmid) [Loktanella salsilacus]|nr:hypothetical protein [Loktanella salsilacus]UTH50146.1 hypothetical protein KBW81_18385 [Loktanella salsilacus]
MGRFEAFLHCVPYVVVKDLKRGSGRVDDLMGLSGPRDAVPGIWVASKGVAAVDDRADVGFIAQQAITLLSIAAERAVTPFGSGGGGDAFLIQLRCNRARRHACRIVGENSTHDDGLFLIDLAVQSLRIGHDAVAISQTRCDT